VKLVVFFVPSKYTFVGLKQVFLGPGCLHANCLVRLD